MKITEKPIMINIKSAHFTPNEHYVKDIATVDVFAPDAFDSVDAQRIDIDYEGTLRIKEGRLEIEYSETELTGMEGTTTNISFDMDNPSIVVMTRSGSVSGTLCFENGGRIMCSQNTPEMELPFVVDTDSLINELTDDGGELKISYGMEFRGSLVQRTIMHIMVRTVS